MTARGIRNNNPGNIRRDGTAWQGMADDQSGDASFIVFTGPEMGIRAIARVLITYQDQHGLHSIREFIRRWAPPAENNTGAYVRAVAASVGIEPDAYIDVHRYEVMRPLVEAIIRHENGSQPYSSAVLDEGLRRAGVLPTSPATVARVVASSRETIGAGAAGAAGLTAAGAALIDSASTMRQVSEGSIALTAVVAVLILLGVGITVYAVWRRTRA